MKLKKSMAILAVVGGLMGATTVASAINVGVVNMAEVYNAYPGYNSLQMKGNQLVDEYRPKIQKEMDAINKMTDQKQQQDAYNQRVVPLEQKLQEGLTKIFEPANKDITAKIEAVRVAKQLPMVIANPNAVVTIEPNSEGVNITPDVINSLKK